MRRRLQALVLVAVAGCAGGGGGDTVETTPPAMPGTSAPPVVSEEPATTTADEPTSAPVEQAQRVVALGEEFLLADLLAIGVRPVASTATVAEVGFQGLGDVDVRGIEVLPATEPNLERLAALRPDVIVTTEFFADELGRDRLEALAETVILPEDLTAEEQLVALAQQFGGEEDADDVATQLEAARTELRGAVTESGCELSVASIYPGPSVAAWVDGTSDIPGALVEAGCTLIPDSAAAAPDDNGRAFLSLEQLGLLSASEMILLQSTTVEGESAAVEQLQADPLWNRLPSVTAGQVTTLDRLGYPGAAGELRLLDDLRSVIAA